MHDLVQNAKQILEKLQGLQLELLEHLFQVTDNVKKGELRLPDLTDIGYFSREVEDLLDEIRKEFKARKELIGRVIAYEVTKNSLNDDAPSSVRGVYAIGTPDVRPIPAIPRAGSPDYELLCNHFGLSKDLTEKGVVQFHFNRLVELVAELQASGKNLPPGITKTTPNFSTVFRKIK